MEKVTGERWDYIKKNWSSCYLNWKLDGILELAKEKQELDEEAANKNKDYDDME